MTLGPRCHIQTPSGMFSKSFPDDLVGHSWAAFFGKLEDCHPVDSTALKHHMWYISEELVALDVFSSDVPPATKANMAANNTVIKPTSPEE